MKIIQIIVVEALFSIGAILNHDRVRSEGEGHWSNRTDRTFIIKIVKIGCVIGTVATGRGSEPPKNLRKSYKYRPLPTIVWLRIKRSIDT